MGGLLVGIVGLALGFVGFVQSLAYVPATLPKHADGVVVLTGGAERVADAVQLLADRKADKLLITGVNKSTSSRAIARQIPQFSAFFSCCITLGYTALNTAGNARETQIWARNQHIEKTLIVVTSNYHMPRALVEISHALPHVRLLPYPVIHHHTEREIWHQPDLRRLVAFEYVKFLVARLRTWILPYAPAHEVGRLRPGAGPAAPARSG